MIKFSFVNFGGGEGFEPVKLPTMAMPELRVGSFCCRVPPCRVELELLRTLVVACLSSSGGFWRRSSCSGMSFPSFCSPALPSRTELMHSRPVRSNLTVLLPEVHQIQRPEYELRGRLFCRRAGFFLTGSGFLAVIWFSEYFVATCGFFYLVKYFLFCLVC